MQLGRVTQPPVLAGKLKIRDFNFNSPQFPIFSTKKRFDRKLNISSGERGSNSVQDMTSFDKNRHDQHDEKCA